METPAKPVCSDTEVLDQHTWRPQSSSKLRAEIDALVASAKVGKEGSVIVFRGQSDSSWTLNSTYARLAQRSDSGIDLKDAQASHEPMLSLYDHLHPTDELLRACRDQEGLDPWFELMKRAQQHPEEFESFGTVTTPLLDWSKSLDVALAFATDSAEREGCVYVADLVAAGPIHAPGKSVRELLDLLRSKLGKGVTPNIPMLVCPTQQIEYERAKRQSPVYLFQTDSRFPLETSWLASEAGTSDGQSIFHRILIRPDIKNDLGSDLASRGVTTTWLLDVS